MPDDPDRQGPGQPGPCRRGHDLDRAAELCRLPDWRTKSGFTDTFEAMLTQPQVIRYYDELYFGEGIAARE